MRKKCICIIVLSIITIAIILLLCFVIKTKRNVDKDMKMPFEKLDDVVKVKVYYGDNRASGSEYVQINEIREFVGFFKNREYVSAKRNNKDGSIAVIEFFSGNNEKTRIVIQNSTMVHVNNQIYKSDNIAEDFRIFYGEFVNNNQLYN